MLRGAISEDFRPGNNSHGELSVFGRGVMGRCKLPTLSRVAAMRNLTYSAEMNKIPYMSTDLVAFLLKARSS